MKKNITLSIAGFDPSGGAGIQADLKSFNVLDVHGLSVVTCIVIQNPRKMKKIHELPVNLIENQIDILLEDIDIKFVKIGMLYSKDIVSCISKKISQYDLLSIADPVLVSTTGELLSKKGLMKSIKEEIFTKSYMVTPNIHEASILIGKKIGNIEDMKNACIKIHKMGVEFVLLKGGHLNKSMVRDVFYDGNKFRLFSLPRVLNKKIHGSGCTLSSLITGLLTLGENPNIAVEKAKFILWNMIDKSYSIGKGSKVLDYSFDFVRGMQYSFENKEYFITWYDLKNAAEKLLTFIPESYIPEVGINFGFAIPNAKKLKDICAIDGRIFKKQNKIIRCSDVRFGVSKHIASVIMAAMSFDPNVRCALNIKHSNLIIQKCIERGLSIGSFDRRDEPKKVTSTIDWGVRKTISQLNSIPDLIFDKGDIGKEPMIRILGTNPENVIKKVNLLSR